MGLFANTLFSVLLGWVQTAASWLWGLITNTNVNAWLRWVLDNWVVLVILLCLAGLAVDLIVYIFRWQPYRVWRNMLQRVKAHKEQPAPQEEHQPMLQRKWVYADGTTEVEDVPVPQPVHVQQPSERLTAPIRPVRRVLKQDTPERAYHQPVYPPHWQNPQEEQGENE